MSNSMLNLSIEELQRIVHSVPSLAPRAGAALAARENSVITTRLPENQPFPARVLALAIEALEQQVENIDLVVVTGFTTDPYAMAGRLHYYDYHTGTEGSLWCDETGRVSFP